LNDRGSTLVAIVTWPEQAERVVRSRVHGNERLVGSDGRRDNDPDCDS